MNSTFEPLLSYLTESNNNLLILLCLLFFVVVSLSYIKIKSKSGFAISNKLYVFLIGNRGGKSKGNKRTLINEIIEIEKFNFHYNTHAVSKRQMHKFESWVNKFELDFKMIAKLKCDFDIEKLKIKKISLKQISVLIIFMIIPCFASIHALFISVKPSLIINIKPVGWFWINKDKASEFSIYNSSKQYWVLTPQICADKTASTIIDKNSAKIICEFFSDNEAESYINENIKYQRAFFMILTFAFFILTMFLYKVIISLLATFKAREMLLYKIMRYRDNRSRNNRYKNFFINAHEEIQE